MIEFNKIFCDLHPNELITNYCCHGTAFFIQNSAMLASVLLVSAHTLNLISNAGLPPITKISEPPTRKCRITLELASLHSNIKNVEL